MRILKVSVALMFLASCAGAPPHPVNIVMPGDKTMSCDIVHAQINNNNNLINRLYSEQNEKVAQNVAAGIGGLFFWPLWFFMDFQNSAKIEISALEQRNNYLSTLTDTCTE